MHFGMCLGFLFHLFSRMILYCVLVCLLTDVLCFFFHVLPRAGGSLDPHHGRSFRHLKGLQKRNGGARDRPCDERLARWKPRRIFVRAIGAGGVASSAGGSYGESCPEGLFGARRAVEGQ